MHVAFLNPQGNFDPNDSYWTEHPDFGGQLVYVKEVALAMAALGHRVDIITRQISDDQWPEFAAPLDGYPGHPNARIVRIPCGPPHFLPKEQLWPHLGTGWTAGITGFYQADGGLPDFFTTHYGDGGLAGALLKQQTGVPFTFTGHSLGAQKLDKLHPTPNSLAKIDARFHFKERIFGERLAMNHAARIITSTRQEQMEQYSHRAYHGAVDPAGADHDRFAVIPPGVNRRVFSPEPGPADATVAARIDTALARDLPPERRALPLVLCSSRLDQKKNHIGLVKAFAENADLRRTANLAIAIRGLDNPLQQRAQLKKAEERAIFDDIARLLDEHNLWPAVTSFSLNSQAELAAAYRVTAARGSVFSLTATYEPFGLAPLEAMSCGLPAVVTQNGGPSESLFDAATGKKFGVLVDPANPADIARGLLEALESPETWQYYQLAGIERVISRYTWDRTAEGYLAAIEQAAAHLAKDGTLSVPDYFTHPGPATEIPLSALADLYFQA
ncbi:MAG: glycosyltransferase family 1 protein [Chloroflexi bacterium]|nr:MAG: glycosyltransferase family 1 protein [Chloroflexota bacterium]